MTAWMDERREGWFGQRPLRKEEAPKTGKHPGYWGKKSPVAFQTVCCPECQQGDKVKTTKTLPPADGWRIRYHRCTRCRINFPSREQIVKKIPTA